MKNLCEFEVGDYELREIIFSIGSTSFMFKNNLRNHKFSINFTNVSLISLDSNLTQNIVGRILELDLQDVNSFNFVRERLRGTNNYDMSSCKKLIYIEPIAGCEVIVVCEVYTIYA